MRLRVTKRARVSLRSGTHVVFDFSGADHLFDLGAKNVVRACDSLGVGPSRREVMEHVRAREVWFADEERHEHDFLHSAEIRWEIPIVVWATPSLHDRLNLWRTCSWLGEKGISSREILVIDLPPTPRGPRAAPRTDPFEFGDSVRFQSQEAVSAYLAGAQPWTRERYDEAVKLWEQFVDPDPRRFARRCLGGVRGFPELRGVWAFLSRFFPRLAAGQELRLGHYDELLLCALTPEWQTPVKVWISNTIQERRDFMSCVGDVTMERRLATWAALDASPAVERAEGPKPGNPMLSSVYRLTERGMRLRECLVQLADAPRLPVGGAEAYAPEAPWVLLDGGQLARVPSS